MPVVLVVDDEPLLLDMLCEMLAELGCKAVCVDWPVKGLEKIAADKRIAMLITDVQPIMDGFELADRAPNSYTVSAKEPACQFPRPSFQ